MEIDDFSRKYPTGEIPMVKNDLCIAAAAYRAGSVLLTTDKDFDHLDDLFFRRILVSVSPR